MVDRNRVNNNNRGGDINLEEIPKERFKNIRQNVSDEDNYLNDNTCIICYNEINEESFVTDLPICHHKYHHSCISEWFKINSKCPLCKTDYVGQFDIEANNLVEDDDIIEAEPLIQR